MEWNLKFWDSLCIQVHRLFLPCIPPPWPRLNLLFKWRSWNVCVLPNCRNKKKKNKSGRDTGFQASFMCFGFLLPVNKNEHRIHFIIQSQTDDTLFRWLTFSNQLDDSLVSVSQELSYCGSWLDAQDQYEQKKSPAWFHSFQTPVWEFNCLHHFANTQPWSTETLQCVFIMVSSFILYFQKE